MESAPKESAESLSDKHPRQLKYQLNSLILFKEDVHCLWDFNVSYQEHSN